MNRCLTTLKNKALLKGVLALMVLAAPQALLADITIGGNVYGGGNRGDLEGTTSVIVNSGNITGSVFGGARMADVNSDISTINNGYASNVTINGGTIHDVYGGNDITGNVYGGAKVAINSSVDGNVYGGGNGSYSYTDNSDLKDDPTWGDFYYNPGTNSIAALNKFRPNMGKVYVTLSGTQAKPTRIYGSVYCGGNSATLRYIDSDEDIDPVTGDKLEPTSHLEIGSYVYAGNVFLGSNGEKMIETNILQKYADDDYSSLDLIDPDTFDEYMKGVQVDIYPVVSFPSTYVDYSSYIGSFFCGGNIGSMRYDGLIEIDFDDKVVIYEKLVGGSNNAYVGARDDLNAVFHGGILGDAGTNGNKLTLNLSGVLIQPKRWNNTRTALEWNVTDNYLVGGSVYGGCYNSGLVNGNVTINIDGTIIEKDNIASESGVVLNAQRDNVLNTAMSVFGGGYGENSEIWGSTTVNLNTGDVFKVFGGSERGIIGKKSSTLAYNPNYSATVNLKGSVAGVDVGANPGDSDDMAEAEIIYGGGFQGPVLGNTYVNLDNGRVYRSFGGSCNADIYGHSETYIGKNGFPWVREHVFGANDLGGQIKTSFDLSGKVSTEASGKVYDSDVTTASAYVEYNQGRADNIFGGANGDYDYSLTKYASLDKPRIVNAFVNFKPRVDADNNSVTRVFGAGQGHKNVTDVSIMSDMNSMQDRSYLLVDIPQSYTKYLTTEFFGSGANSGLGMLSADGSVGVTYDEAKTNTNGVVASAVVDLIRGKIGVAYGGSYAEGITRRTIVNVPDGSTVTTDSIFGGAYGVTNINPCDVYEAIVNYSSSAARIRKLFGGNNAYRRSLYTKVNLYSPLKQSNGWDGNVYGAGFGKDSWAQYTEVNLDGATLYEAYGGGYGGEVLNKESVTEKATREGLNIHLGNGYDNTDATYDHGGLNNFLVRVAELYTDTQLGEQKYNTNVLIKEDTYISNYCYGGGYGETLPDKSTTANISGTTYIALLGGTVNKDMYASGTTGSVINKYSNITSFTATASAYVMGGTVRNVYGGGWRGSVGYHDPNHAPTTDSDISGDILGESNVVIGNLKGNSFLNGIPAIKRNVYGGGEGGAIYGTANVYIINGYVGYHYNDSGTDNVTTADFDEHYEEELDESEPDDNVLYNSGNVFGGGYVANSYVDVSKLRMYGGIVRNSLYGGGEIGPIGRGTVNGPNSTLFIAKAGEANVYLYKGHVMRDVFGGGRGLDNWGGEGYMTDEEKLTMDLSSKGYVFGKTNVYIYGGEVGTDAGIGMGYGNVFGGGDIGYVYTSDGTKNNTDGYYYNGSTLTEDCKVVVQPYSEVLSPFDSYTVGQYLPTFVPTDVLDTYTYNDSRWSKLDNTGITIHNAVFAGGNVSTGSDKVYANTNTVYGNATASVIDLFEKDMIAIGDDGVGGLYGDGNLTFVDGYRELNITNYGTDYNHLDHSLTYEDYQLLNKRQKAYYELKYQSKEDHIYSYYMCKVIHSYQGLTYKKGQKITADTYNNIQDNEEKAYWTAGNITYAQNDQITENEFDLMNEEERSKWTLYGFCTLFEGRMINTIQRADFCGVFGSRIVLRGALDRVPSIVDYTEYTINRVDELSLNQKTNTTHNSTNGNYFGIYNVVNYLGALTSDVKFIETADKRVTDNDTYKIPFTVKTGNYIIYKIDGENKFVSAGLKDTYTTTPVVIDATYVDNNILDYASFRANTSYSSYEFETENSNFFCDDEEQEIGYGSSNATYYNWKKANLNNRSRNNGTSMNVVSLASGVWLEILDKSTETSAEKIYGPITGVVQLDLINVATGEGGGYVYAANQHGVLTSSSAGTQVTISAANTGAVSRKQFTYSTSNLIKMQTSGNFVNSLKRIVDDCYPMSGAYSGTGAAPAHYWYIRGDYYVYDQYISAYTGSAQAYAEVVSIPLTITAESQGKIELESVNTNLYAFWNDDELLPKYKSTTDENAIIVGGKTYHKNDPISYWAWSHLTEAEQDLFVDNLTYVCTNSATYNNVEYKAGDILLSKPADIYVCTQSFTYIDKNNNNNEVDYTQKVSVITKAQWEALDEISQSKFAVVFNPSNVVDKENGFVLTFDWDNPDIWNDYYHQTLGTGKVRSSAYNSIPDNYITSPSYYCNTGGVFGQVKYSLGDIIDKVTYDYEAALGESTPSDQASFDIAYVAKANCQFTDGGHTYQYVKGACITKAQYDAFTSNTSKSYFAVGMLCTETYQKTTTEYYLNGDVIPIADYNTLLTEDAGVAGNFSAAYICSSPGWWGGEAFVAGNNYPAVKYSNLSKSERANFTFNYDAFNLLIDEAYTNNLPLYDSSNPQNGKILYSKQQSIDYTATYNGNVDATITNTVSVTRGNNVVSTNVLKKGDVLSNTVYESLINEQYNFTPIVVLGSDVIGNENLTYYIVNSPFQVGDKAYIPGNQLSADDFSNLNSENIARVTQVTKAQLAAVEALPTSSTDSKRYYFCTKPFTSSNSTSYSLGSIIKASDYANLTNEQKNFTIDGLVPSETSTLYVAREANIDQLSSDRILTVAYWYDYIESDETGSSYENIREKHIVNIHIHFESGVPTIGQLLPPSVVLPGDMVSLNKPTVTKGAYEILGGGWEIFPDEAQAVNHQNGSEYSSYGTPTFWYQDGYYVAYYAKSYLGKTYSNPVKLTVANYHRMADVMESQHEVIDFENNQVSDVNDYMYLNEAVAAGKRNPKVYIRNASELSQLKSFYDLTKTGDSFTNIRNCLNIDFIIDGDIVLTDSWTPIGDAGNCFDGKIHGDGHTISGLNNSLFNYLCGEVYNLGVTGTFTGAGIAETGDGFVENCWISTTSTAAKTNKPVFGNPTGNGVKIVNSYYQEEADATNPYAAHTGSYGAPIRRDAQAFYNGEVAYDLNGFYLYKRYSDKTLNSGSKSYSYYKVNADNTLSSLQTGYYGTTDGSLCSSGFADNLKYVEDRIGDGDFIYANGSVPESADEREFEDEYYPIWPDDYIFFGQKLTYGHVTGRTHQDIPSRISKSNNRISSSNGNRVYRAPAYFQSKDMSVAYYNSDAVFAQSSADGNHIVYPGMTAIDFTGYNDVQYQKGRIIATPYDKVTDGAFYPPLLDDAGLHSFTNKDLTKNLLVYIPQATANATDAASMTNSVITDYMADPVYAEGTTNAGYRTVAAYTGSSSMHGHRVLKDATGTGYTAPVDHFLVDKNDFNAPIEYTFATGKRMWYQRVPETYVDLTNKGWGGISLPFTVELVTTQTKGEITHFYSGSNIADEDATDGTKVGHEYWLRKFTSGGSVDGSNSKIFNANFKYPEEGSTDKNVSNTFLYDYYYSKSNQHDENSDTYHTYYNSTRTYTEYAYAQAGTPYIIGFPGSNYYEFDLSGSFVPANTEYKFSSALPKQTITFASNTAVTINVSDDELAAAAAAHVADGYRFNANYMSKPIATGSYVLNAEGSSYTETTADQPAVPFRPYFTAVPSSPAPERYSAVAISPVTKSQLEFEGEYDPDNEDQTDMLNIFARRGKIVVESLCRSKVSVRIVNSTGMLIDIFDIQPGEVIETPISSSGIYFVNDKKLRVTGR